MKVTFEIELKVDTIERLDYYENYGDMMSSNAGCKKCIFQPMCNYFVENISINHPNRSIDCKFPCWNSNYDRKRCLNRGVFVMKKEKSQNK